MKTKKLRLAEFSKKKMPKKQMKTLKGGDWCLDKCGTISPPAVETTIDWFEYFYW